MSTRNVLTLVVAVLASGILALRGSFLPEERFSFPDAFHYAEIGRQLARGEGFTTLQTYPYVLAWMRGAGVSPAPPWPNVARFPLLPLLYAPVFWLAGATTQTTLTFGSGFFVLTAASTFLLGARLFGAGVGVTGALVFMVSLAQFGFARSGLLETPAAFLIVAATLGVVATLGAPSEGRGARGRPVLLGLLVGVAVLLRFDLAALAGAAVLVLAVGRGGPGRRQAAWLVLGVAAPVALWVLHNVLAFGSPFVFLGLDRNVLVGSRLVDLYASSSYEGVWSTLARRPEILAGKLATVLWPLGHWPHLFGGRMDWLSPLFVAAGVGLLVQRHPARRAYLFVVLAFVFRALVFSLTHHELRFYLSFAPVVLVLALGGAWTAVATLLPARWSPRVGAALAIALVIGTVSTQLAPRELAWRLAPRGEPPDPVYALIHERTPPGTVIATTRSEQIAWYGERPAVGIQPNQLAAVQQLGVTIDGLLFPSTATSQLQNALQRQGLHDQFERVYTGARWTLWLRPELARHWHESIAATGRAGATSDQAG